MEQYEDIIQTESVDEDTILLEESIPVTEQYITYEVDNSQIEALITQTNYKLDYIYTSLLWTLGVTVAVFVVILLYKFIKIFY